MSLRDHRAVLQEIRKFWHPPPRLKLSEWADENFVLSAENSAEAGRWKTIPYQRGILDALTDPSVTQISFMKSSRVGATKMMCVAVAYHIVHEPTTMLFVQPTIEAAAQFSKEEIAVMLRDVPALQGVVSERAKDTESTIAQKMFPGGTLQLVGANSGNGFRRVSRRIIYLDEVDSYPASAGDDGDPVTLAIRRSEYYWNRKTFAASTPLLSGLSRIERLYNAGDRRKYFVPCPECGHMAPLVFSGDEGHSMKWPEGKPELAFFACQKNGCAIEHSSKRDMISRGEWRASGEFAGHASFHISALYSYSPNASWGDIAREFLAAKGNVETLKTFVNTVLGETWKERGDAPDWERLYARREHYGIGSVPEGVRFLTAGVDVQKDRWVYEVVGWSEGKESWSIDAGVIMGDTSNEGEWARLDDLLNRTFHTPSKVALSILTLAVDAGFNTQMVYNWARRHPMSRVIAVKGVSTARTLIGSPSPVDINFAGKKVARGYKIWPVGVDVAKSELYGWLRLPVPVDGQPYPHGFCHFPEHGEDYFRQLTSEQLVSSVTTRGYTRMEWQQMPGRENHWLDARVYARAAAARAGLDRMRAPAPDAAPVKPPEKPVMMVPLKDAPQKPKAAPSRQIADSQRFLGRAKGSFWKKR